MSDGSTQRPALTRMLTGAELRRWYWLKSELASFARVLGIATSGSKEELTTRLAAVLDGLTPPSSTRAADVSGDQLSGELTAATVIPPGQRSSQELRGWFTTHVGLSFRFDRHMRDFIHAADGTTTLGDAVKYWQATRDDPVTSIEPQFEFNRFTRAWYGKHPSASRADLLAAWNHYRSLPVDARGRA